MKKNPSVLVETDSIRKFQILHPSKTPVIKKYHYGVFPWCKLERDTAIQEDCRAGPGGFLAGNNSAGKQGASDLLLAAT